MTETALPRATVTRGVFPFRLPQHTFSRHRARKRSLGLERSPLPLCCVLSSPGFRPSNPPPKKKKKGSVLTRSLFSPARDDRPPRPSISLERRALSPRHFALPSTSSPALAEGPLPRGRLTSTMNLSFLFNRSSSPPSSNTLIRRVSKCWLPSARSCAMVEAGVGDIEDI